MALQEKLTRLIRKPPRIVGPVVGGALLVAAGVYFLAPKGKPPTDPEAKQGGAAATELELNEKQVASLKIEKVTQHDFLKEKQAIGNIDFNQNLVVSVFTPYQGRIIAAYPNTGDRIEKGDVIFTIDSPDLLAAESTLIAASGVLVLQSRTLNRAKALIKVGGISQQMVDQTTSDEQTADGVLKTARNAVRIFGKTEAEIDQIIAGRKADPRLVVKSPISGFVTARAAAPGLFVQPGVAPAPFTIADTSTMWMVANIVEDDAAAIRVGQRVKATVDAFPNREFDGKVTVIGPSVDPITRRVFVRSEVADPEHVLRAGMFAKFAIVVGDPVRAPAVHSSAVVREGDGAMTAWVTKDRLHFTRRTVIVGERQDDLVEISAGLAPDELVVDEGAVFLSNQAAIAPGK